MQQIIKIAGIMEKEQLIEGQTKQTIVFFVLLIFMSSVFHGLHYVPKSWAEWVVFVVLAALFLAYVPFYIIKAIKKCERARYLLWIVLASALLALCGGVVSFLVNKLDGFNYFIFPACIINACVPLYGAGYLIWSAVKKNPIVISDIWSYTLPVYYFPFLVNSSISLA